MQYLCQTLYAAAHALTVCSQVRCLLAIRQTPSNYSTLLPAAMRQSCPMIDATQDVYSIWLGFMSVS